MRLNRKWTHVQYTFAEEWEWNMFSALIRSHPWMIALLLLHLEY